MIESTPETSALARRLSRVSSATSAILLAIGFLSRLLPLFDHGGRVLRQFPTEDGYLMLTIARNLALGNGPSIAEGTILTNGTQPLATLLFAGCFALAGGDRFWGVLLVQVVELAIACGSAFLLWRLGSRFFSREVAGLATAIWFASPIVVRHSMNCLESGLYVACVLWVCLLLFPAANAPRAQPRIDARRWALLGLALATCFWARNDAVLLCLAVGFVHLAGRLIESPAPFPTRVAELSIAAVIVTALASPWLAFNLIGFGHLMPISGQAESLNASFGGNLSFVPPKLLEYATLLLPIPGAMEEWALVIVGATLTLALVGVVLVRHAARAGFELRALICVAAAYGGMLAMFYGLYFGAEHFMSRYLLPTSPFFALLWASGLWWAGRTVRSPRGMGMAGAAAVIAIALAFGLNARLYVQGTTHEHFQVVEWTQRNVPDDVWVGAIQTGTLGFFHDRTLNLDGKVNPLALEARKVDGVPDYVRESEIVYLIDWAGLANWGSRPRFASNFEVIVRDPELNLAVLKRRDPT